MKLYKVKYNFNAEEEGELTVRKGDLLRLASTSEDEEENKDGWTLVETLSPPFAKGYVPANYIVKAESATSARSYTSSPQASPVGSHFGRPRTAGSQSGSEMSVSMRKKESSSSSSHYGTREKSPTRTSRFAPIRRLSDPRLPQHLLETLEGSDTNSEGPRDYALTQEANPPSLQSPMYSNSVNYSDTRVNQLANPTAHVDLNKLFASHDHWLAQVLEEREREYTSFENSIGSVYKALQKVNEKNQDVVSKILSLEAQVESQRQQLKHRIDDDNAKMDTRFAKLYA